MTLKVQVKNINQKCVAMHTSKLQSTAAIIVAMTLFAGVTYAQDATDYLPQYGGSYWLYTTEFTDVMDEFEEDFPEEIVQRDSVISIDVEDTLTVYRLVSKPLNDDFDNGIVENDFDDWEGEPYGWLVYQDQVSPLLELPDDFDEELPLRTTSTPSFTTMEGVTTIAQQFDPEQLEFLPLFRFNTVSGDNWTIIDVDEIIPIPEDVREDDEFPDFIEAIEIRFALEGSRHDAQDVEMDEGTVSAEVFGTSVSLSIEVHTEEGAEFPNIVADILDDYTLSSYWAPERGAVRMTAEPYSIDMEEIEDLIALLMSVEEEPAEMIASALTIQQDEPPEEIVIPGIQAQMSEYEEGDRDVSSEIVDADYLPDSPELSQNYPNPFNPATTIEYAIPENGQVKLEIYDITGRHITTLVDETQQAGAHQVTWDASNAASGVYIYRLQYGDVVISNEMTLIK